MTNQARHSELHAPLEEVRGRQPAETRQDVRELRGEFKSLVRTFVVSQTTAMVGLTGIFIGVNQLQ